MNSRAAARLPLEREANPIEDQSSTASRHGEVAAPARPLTVAIVVPTLHAGAADAGAVDLVRILAAKGHRAIVVSQGGQDPFFGQAETRAQGRQFREQPLQRAR